MNSQIYRLPSWGKLLQAQGATQGRRRHAAMYVHVEAELTKAGAMRYMLRSKEIK